MTDFTEPMINLDTLIKSKTEYIVAKDLARYIKQNGLTTVGTSMSIISDVALDKLVHTIDHINDENHTIGEEILLIAMLLLQGEGGHLDLNERSLQRIMEATVGFICIESLARKGLVDLNRTNMSFDDASGNRPLGKVTQAGLDFHKGVEND